MTHFHYYETEAMHCNRWFCSLENRVDDIMQTFAVISTPLDKRSDAIDAFTFKHEAERSSMEREEEEQDVVHAEIQPAWFEDEGATITETAETQQEHNPYDDVFWSSSIVRETDRRRFYVIVPEDSDKEAHRRAIHELFQLSRIRDEAVEVSGQEAKLFSFVREDGGTEYFFDSVEEDFPYDFDADKYREVRQISEIADLGAKIPVTKLPPVAARKLFEV